MPTPKAHPRAGPAAVASAEPADEGQRRLRDLLPAIVNGQRVPPARNLSEFGDAGALELVLVGGVGEDVRYGVVLLTGHDQHRSPLTVLRVDLVLGPRVEVRRRCLP